MGIAPRQIGWSNESNLLWQLSKQLERLNGVTSTSLNTIIADLSTKVTNQQGVPSFRADTFANIPAAGQTGRMFVSTDTLSIYRDNGTTWDLISGGSSGVAGSGTINYLSKWTGATAIGNSQIFDNGTSVGIGTATPLSTSNLTISQANTTSGGIFITTPSQPTYGMILRNINNATTQNELLIGSINQPATGSRGLVVRGFNSGVVELWARNVDNTTQIDLSIGQLFNATRFFAATKNVSIGSDTDAGFKLDVNGTFRSSGDATINGVTAGRGNGNISTNTSFGVLTFQGFNPTGNENSAFGFQAINLLTTGQRNTGIGLQALLSTSTGNRNTGLGYRAGLYISSGSDNTIIGNNNAINLTTGVHNTVLGSNTGHGIVTGSYNVVIGGNVTSLSSSLSNTIILADGQGNIRQYIDSTGNVGIGTTTLDTTVNYTSLSLVGASGSYISFRSGSTQIFRLENNNTTLGIDLKVVTNSPLIFSTNNAERGRFQPSGNFLIGTTTDAGYKLNVNGSALIGDSSAPTNPAHINFVKSGNTSAGIVKITALTAGQGGTLILEGNAFQSSIGFRASPYGNADFTIGTDLYTLGAGTYDGYLANANGAVAHFRYANRSSIFWRGMTINEDGADSDTRIEGDTNQNLFFIDASVDNIGMGTNTPNASALLDISSTTKGFLPPRMTGAQAEAIASPAEGLMVYSTDGSGTTITSKGWWGFEGATWVKLN